MNSMKLNRVAAGNVLVLSWVMLKTAYIYRLLLVCQKIHDEP